MIFDEFLKGLIKHINSEAVIACHGLTSRSQPIQKIPISICVIHGTWFIFVYYLVGFDHVFETSYLYLFDATIILKVILPHPSSTTATRSSYCPNVRNNTNPKPANVTPSLDPPSTSQIPPTPTIHHDKLNTPAPTFHSAVVTDPILNIPPIIKVS